MRSLEAFLDDQLARGQSSFSREEALRLLSVSPEAFTAAATRLVKKQKLYSPRHEFFVILRPEDRVLGPDPVRWIDALMRHQGEDYRISLLSAAAQHGSSHQAPMVIQVIVPRQLRALQVVRRRIQFFYQKASTFTEVNKPDWLQQIKTNDGFAKVAGIEVTLLDCMRYLRAVGGIDGAAQIVRDIGGKAGTIKLARIAQFYEAAVVRRLGYLMHLFHHRRQAAALESFVTDSSTYSPLDPTVKPISPLTAGSPERNETWRLLITRPVEIDY